MSSDLFDFNFEFDFDFDFDSELQFLSSDPLLAFCDHSAINGPDILLRDSIDQLSSADSYSLGGPGTVSLDFPVGFQDRSGSGFTGAQVGALKDDWSPVRYEAFSGPHSYGGYESGVSSMEKYMQRSYSSSSFEEKPLDALMESADFQGQGMVGSPENCFHGAPMRRVCSAGDLQLPAAASYSLGRPGTVSLDFPVGFQDRSGSGFTGAQVGALKDDWSPVRYEAFSGPHSYGGYESGVSSMEKYMQRSYSSSSFEEKPLDALMESADFQGHGTVDSPENRFHGAPMRRVCSTGDLQRTSSPCPLVTESSLADEPTLKVGRYSAKEREERILKYRAKRTQRNFTKTIKYACRKTLADTRPRIRGRFARNDEIGELPNAASPAMDADFRAKLEELKLSLLEDEDFGAGSG